MGGPLSSRRKRERPRIPKRSVAIRTNVDAAVVVS